VSYSPALIPATGGLIAVTEGTSGPVRLCLAPQRNSDKPSAMSPAITAATATKKVHLT
jgi:hypothetical protein